mmetsp:Transcript_103199/g.297187  ORF Transcript_103199/g.297187 Transcript_103199/m.297187 type:complete len:422 (+) Transcript_103199:420-1685(+)
MVEALEDEGARVHVADDVVAAPLVDLLVGHRLPWLADDPRHRRLAPLFVGAGDDSALRDLRVLQEQALYLKGRDVLAAGNDDVLGTVLQLDVAVGVDDAQIAGVEHAVAELLLGRRGVLVVALHDGVPPHDHLADGLPVMRHGLPGGLVVHVQVLQLQAPHPLAGQQRRALLNGLAVPLVILPLAHHAGAVCLGEAVDVADLDAESAHLREHRRRRRRGRGHELHCLRPLARARVLQHRAHDDRGAADVRDAVLLHRGEDVLRDDLPQAHMHTSSGRHGVGEKPAVEVEHRHRPQEHRMAKQGPLHEQVDRLQVRAAMVQQHPLRVRRGAAGVAKGECVPFVQGRRPGGVWVPFGQEVLVGHRTDAGPVLLAQRVVDVYDEGALVPGEQVEGVVGDLAVLAVHDEDLGLRMPQHEAQHAGI